MKKQEELRHELQNSKIKFILGDVREKNSIEDATKDVDLSSAAALKQVPSCEFQPSGAYKTNIIGTEKPIDAAINKVKINFIKYRQTVYQ